jgi:hypothetical protein
VDLGNSPDAEQRAKFDASFAEGKFGPAFAAYQLGLLRRALALLGKQSYQIGWQREPASTLEFAGGIAAALDAAIAEAGEHASYKLLVVRDVVGAVAEMQALLTTRDAPDQDAFHVLGRLILQGVRLGTFEVALAQADGGFLDEYADLKWREHLDLERRRKGAAGANDSRHRKRLEVLLTAQEIAKANASLPNDDLAFRLKERLRISQSVRTITGWIRGWRKDGRLPPLR